jgi:RNA polymerase sigma-70 factor (ECF subfamily)
MEIKAKKDLHSFDEQKLVAEAKKGNKRAFDELIRRYEGQIYSLIFRITYNKEDTSDIFQETFIQAYKKLSTFRGESKFSTWLYRIATNLSLMKKRKDKKVHILSLDKPITTDRGNDLKREFRDDWSRTPLEILESKEVYETLDRIIMLMPVKYRAVLILRDINGMSNKEVSKITNISVPAVKSRVHRARLFIREKLSQYLKS